jgi:hypothetical protein
MTDLNTKNSDEGSAVFPSASIGSAAATDFTGNGGREPIVHGEYPVPGRSREYDRRVAGHEIGHAFLARALGSNVHYVTIIPGDGYEGRCVRSGPPSQYNLDEAAEPTTEEIVDICSRLERLSPEIGSGRVESAESYVRAQTLCIELVGGHVAERILHPDHPPLPTQHDHIEAAAFATVACAAPSAVNALLAYAEAEAAALIREHLNVVLALVDAIIDRGGTLTGSEVDEVIAAAVAVKAAADERQRRAAWKRIEASAASFADLHQ